MFHSILAIVVTVAVVVLTGGIGLGVLLVADSASCSINIYWGCSSGGGGGGSTATVGASCSSAPNACGMTNIGTIVQTGAGTGSCNATPPPDSSCPVPTLPSGTGFYASPSTIGPGDSTTLHWNAENATTCTITGDNGFSYTGDTSGSIPTGMLAQTTTFTLTCSDGATGPSASASIKVLIDPHYQEI